MLLEPSWRPGPENLFQIKTVLLEDSLIETLREDSNHNWKGLYFDR